MGKDKEKKSKAAQKIEDEKIQKIVKRLEGEEIVKERVNIEAKLMPSPPNQEGVNVRIKLQILDKSFYAKGAKLFYNAGLDKFEVIEMAQIDLDNFAVNLDNIPKEIQILYYVQILDKSGVWTQFPRPEKLVKDSAEEPYFSFSVEPNGTISFKKEWDDAKLSKCPVCGYACQPNWDICPECKTPLYDTMQEVFQDAQDAKIKALKAKKAEEPGWEDATDEEWRSLPECPNCGYTVQMDWHNCPVCNFDLSTVKLEKKESYQELMTEEEKEKKEESSQISEVIKKKDKIDKKSKEGKEKAGKSEWKDEQGIDIL